MSMRKMARSKMMKSAAGGYAIPTSLAKYSSPSLQMEKKMKKGA